MRVVTVDDGGARRHGVEAPIPGQSLYRLRDGKVCFVADYVDAAAHARLRGDRGKPADLAGGAGLSVGLAPNAALGEYPALDIVRRFWQVQDAGDYT